MDSNNKEALFTIASKNYISFVRTVLNSVKKHNGGIDLYFLLADESDGYFDKTQENFRVVEARELRIQNYKQMTFRYNIIEFNTSLKPFFIEYLLDKGYEKIIYLDPDIMVFDKLQFIYELLDKYSLILTPHITRPILENEVCYTPDNMFLLAGTFNLGFIAISDNIETRELVKWWMRKCTFESIIDPYYSGCFVDQKWCTLFPGFLNNIFTLRHPGCNMSIWNLHERELSDKLVNGDFSLIFYHFSGFDPSNNNCLSKNQDVFTFETRPDLKNIFMEYTKSIFKYGYSTTNKWPYKYATFHNGVHITQIARQLFPNVEKLFSDPFSIENDSYYSLLLNKKLITLNKSENMSDTSSPQKHSIDRYTSLLTFFLKLCLKLFGPYRYAKLLDFTRKAIDIRKQDYLLK